MRVAVLDTGAEATHPALLGHLLPGWDFVDNDADPGEAGSREIGPYGHGTHVSGIIALVAPEAKIIPVRVLNQYGIGNSWVLLEGLTYALDPDGDPGTDDGANVINLSLTTPRELELVEHLLAKVVAPRTTDDPLEAGDNFPCVHAADAIVVAAAGNGMLMTDFMQHDSRARLLRIVADAPVFQQAEYNKAFVLLQYFGYLRRDADPAGYSFWLGVMNNQQPGNYRGMVCAFLTSTEYQERFSSISTRNNTLCNGNP